MRKLVPKPQEQKPLKSLNKSITKSQSTISQTLHNTSIKLIDDPEKIQNNILEKDHIILIIRDEMATILAETASVQERLKTITEEIHEERNLNSQLISNLKDDIQKLTTKLETNSMINPDIKKQTIKVQPQTEKLNAIQSNISLIFEKLDQTTDARILANMQQKHLQQINSINKGVEGLGIQMRSSINKTQLEVAILRDAVTEVEDALHQHISTVGDKMRLFDMEKALNRLIQKVNMIANVSQRSTVDIQKLHKQVDIHQLFIEKYELRQQNLKQFVDSNIEHIKALSESQSNDLEQFLSSRLGKMIESYNNNFQEMDRSVGELRQTVKEVLQINRIITDNLSTKLRNTIDNNTFNNTIANLNQKFVQTYLMNHQRIQQLNSKEYEVQHELSYMKDMIENLKLDFKNGCSKLRLEEQVSVSQDKNSNLDGSVDVSAEKFRGFKKPNYIFPERGSFNYAQQRKKRRSAGVNDEIFGFVGRGEKEY